MKTTTLVVLGLCGAAGVALAVYLTKKDEKENDASPAAKATNEAAVNLEPVTPPASIGEPKKEEKKANPILKELSKDRIEDSLRRLNRDPTNASFNAEDQKLKDVILNRLDYEPETLSALSSTVRILTAEWLVTASMLGHLFEQAERDALTYAQVPALAAQNGQANMTPPSGEQLLQSVNKVRSYMSKAWLLLDTEADDPQAVRARDFLMLDVAGKLKDGEKMKSCFEKLRQKTELAIEEVMSLFANAPLLGMWGDMIELGNLINRQQPDSLEVFHVQAMNTPSVIDFSALFALVKDGQNLPAPLPNFACQTYKVLDMKMRFKQVNAGNPDNAAFSEVLRQFKEWQSIPSQPAVHFHQIGNAAHWVNPGAIPIPLAGIFSENEIRLKGYVDMGDESAKLRHWETYTLRPAGDDRPGVWVGTDDVDQKRLAGRLPPDACQSFSFEIELRLEKDDDALWKVL